MKILHNKINSFVSLDNSEESDERKATVGVEITNVDINTVNTALQNYQQTTGAKTDMTTEEIITFVKEAIAQNKDTTIYKRSRY